MNRGYKGLQNPHSNNNDFNALSFLVTSLINKMATTELVVIKAVSGKTVDVQPLVLQVDGNGRGFEHGVIHSLPFLRLQGGFSGIKLDPVVGDIGLVVFAGRDISSVKANAGPALPASNRRFDWADGIYVPGLLNQDPTQFLEFTGAGIRLKSPYPVTLETPQTVVTGAMSLGTPLAIAYGGTQATSASQARSNLNVPAIDGSGAGGVWPISITGVAAGGTTGPVIWSQVSGTGRPADYADVTANSAAMIAANAELVSIGSDSVLSKGEKPRYIRDWDTAQAEYTPWVAQATALGVGAPLTAFLAAYSALNTYLAGLTNWTVVTVDTAINGTTFANTWLAYLSAKEALATACANAASLTATWGGVSGTGKPADYATVGAPSGTMVGSTLAQTVESNASTAFTNAATALTNAATANAELANLASDNILSPVEKPTVILDYAAIIAEQAGIDAQATAYSITTEKTAYDASVTALTSYLNGLGSWNNTNVSTTIVGTTFRTNFANVYAARQTLLNKIAAVAGTLATWSNVSGTGRPADYADVTANSAAMVAANARIADILSDSVITAGKEKTDILNLKDRIAGEYNKVSTQAYALGVSYSALITAYDNWYNYFIGLPNIANTTLDTAVNKATYDAYYLAYSNAVIDVENAIGLQINTRYTGEATNGNFDNWPNPAVLPVGWNNWYYGAARKVRRADGKGGFALGLNTVIGDNFCGIVGDIKDARPKSWVVFYVSLKLESGAFDPASTQAFANVYNAGITTVGAQWQIVIGQQKKTDGTLVGVGEVGKTYSFSVIKQVDATYYRVEPFCMNMYNGTPATAAADITWLECDWRPATDAEIQAELARLELANIASDNIVSKDEKPRMRQMWDDIYSEVVSGTIRATADSLGIDRTAFNNAYNALVSMLSPNSWALTTLGTDTAIADRNVFNNTWNAYYLEERKINDAIGKSTSNVPLGNNQIVNSNFIKGTYGWQSSIGGNPQLNAAGHFGQRDVIYGSYAGTLASGAQIDFIHTKSPWDGVGTLTDLKKFGMQIKQGDTVYASARVAYHRLASVTLWALVFNKDGTFIDVAGAWTGGTNGGASGGLVSNFALLGYVCTPIAHADAAYMILMLRGYGSGEAHPYVFMIEPAMGKVPTGQKVLPPYTDGRSDPVADETANSATMVAAQAALTAISSDSVLSKGEKPRVATEYVACFNEYTPLVASAVALSVSPTAYQAAFTALQAYITGLTPPYSDYAQDTAIVSATFTTKFTDYYAAKTALLNALDAKAATLSTWSGVTGTGKPVDYADKAYDGSGKLVNANSVDTVNIANGAITNATSITSTGAITPQVNLSNGAIDTPPQTGYTDAQSATLTTTGGNVLVSWSLATWSNPAGSAGILYWARLKRDGTVIADFGEVYHHFTTSKVGFTINGSFTDVTPSAAAHTYSIELALVPVSNSTPNFNSCYNRTLSIMEFKK